VRKYFWKEREGGKYLCRERGKSEEIFLERERVREILI